jgi:hypothetical protein
VLKVPEPFIPPAGARIMSLQVGSCKGLDMLVADGQSSGSTLRAAKCRAATCCMLTYRPSCSSTSHAWPALLPIAALVTAPQLLRSLTKDGTAKMSKSAENDASRINLTDTASEIAAKVGGGVGFQRSSKHHKGSGHFNISTPYTLKARRSDITGQAMQDGCS